MSRIVSLAVAGVAAAGTTLTRIPAVQAAPLPALGASHVPGDAPATVDRVGWRRGYSGDYGGGYPAYGYGGPAYGDARPVYGWGY